MAQYQHYIPQFILRNFSHPYQPPKGEEIKRGGKPRFEKGKHKGDKVLNVVDLTSDEPHLLEQPICRWFGQDDMYKDFADAIRSKKDVEKELSKLESWTARILQKVEKAHNANESEVWLTRVERNNLRKFLFIMKYRGLGFHEKYFAKSPQAYDSEDKHLLRAYMAEQGMTSPRDVWLHNLRAILDLDMDAAGKWSIELPKRMFPPDAAMFHIHVQASYMSFCTPADKLDEFILTDQCYNVFEGPTNETFCARTGEFVGNSYLCFHDFGPLSPRLIIVLRSCMLPEALDDMDPKARKSTQMMFNAIAVQFPDPQNVKSILSDLPVAKATNSYSRVINGRLELAPGQTGEFKSRDKFCFRFWPIATKHVDTINAIFLDNLLHCKSVVFDSEISFRRTLDAYMTRSTDGFKTAGIGEHGARISRLACIKKLSVVLKLLGSDSIPVWSDEGERGRKILVQSLEDVWLEIMKKLLEDFNHSFPGSGTTPFWQAYYALGGSQKTFLEDLDQSWRLYKLQALVYSSVVRLESDLRLKVYTNVLDFILQMHPRRVWMYVKHRRWMFSAEHAMHQKFNVGAGLFFAAKTEALFKAEREDEVVMTNLTTNPHHLSGLINTAGAS